MNAKCMIIITKFMTSDGNRCDNYISPVQNVALSYSYITLKITVYLTIALTKTYVRQII